MKVLETKGRMEGKMGMDGQTDGWMDDGQLKRSWMKEGKGWMMEAQLRKG